MLSATPRSPYVKGSLLQLQGRWWPKTQPAKMAPPGTRASRPTQRPSFGPGSAEAPNHIAGQDQIETSVLTAFWEPWLKKDVGRDPTLNCDPILGISLSPVQVPVLRTSPSCSQCLHILRNVALMWKPGAITGRSVLKKYKSGKLALSEGQH